MTPEVETPAPVEIVLATRDEIIHLTTLLTQVQQVLNLGEISVLDDTGTTSVSARISRAMDIITAIDNYLGQSNARLNMRNDVLLRMLQAALVTIAQQNVRLDSINDVLALNAANYQQNVELLNSYRQEALAEAQLQTARDQLQDAKDELQQEAIVQLQVSQLHLAADQLATQVRQALAEAETSKLASRATALELATAVNTANDLLEAAKQTQTTADLALLAANLEKVRLQQLFDQTGIEVDRVAAAQALTAAQTAQAGVTKAQQDITTLTTGLAQARAAAAAAQDKADLDAQNITVLSGQLTTAQAALTTANQNLTSQTLRVDSAVANIITLQNNLALTKATADNATLAIATLSNKGRVLIGIAVPAVTILNGGTQELPVTISPPLADNVYAEAFTQTSGALGATNYSIKLGSKTASGFILVRSNAGTLTLLAPAAVVDIILSKP